MTKLTKLLFAVIIAATCMSVPAFAEMFTYSPMLTAEYVSKVTGPGLPMSILYTVDSDGHVTREETIQREYSGTETQTSNGNVGGDTLNAVYDIVFNRNWETWQKGKNDSDSILDGGEWEFTAYTYGDGESIEIGHVDRYVGGVTELDDLSDILTTLDYKDTETEAETETEEKTWKYIQPVEIANNSGNTAIAYILQGETECDGTIVMSPKDRSELTPGFLSGAVLSDDNMTFTEALFEYFQFGDDEDEKVNYTVMEDGRYFLKFSRAYKANGKTTNITTQIYIGEDVDGKMKVTCLYFDVASMVLEFKMLDVDEEIINAPVNYTNAVFEEFYNASHVLAGRWLNAVFVMRSASSCVTVGTAEQICSNT